MAAGGNGSLDVLLTEAARGPVRSWWPGMSGAKAAAKLAVRPDMTVRRSAELAAELARITVGRSETEPSKGDRRFKDEAWTGNPAFRRLMQAYLATGRAADKLICDRRPRLAGASGACASPRERARRRRALEPPVDPARSRPCSTPASAS